MNVNKTEFNIGVKWNENIGVKHQKITDWSKLPKPANVDKMVLHPVVAKTVYTKNELLKGSANEQTACVATYRESTLVFSDGSTLHGKSNDAYFAINLDKHPRDFYESEVDMRNIESAVEETWEYTEYSYENSSFRASISDMTGGAFEISAASARAAAATASHTEGAVIGKDGAISKYVQNSGEVGVVDKTEVAASVQKAAPVEEKSAANGLTDRDIFVIFTGKEPKKSMPNPFGSAPAFGTEDMFDKDGNLIYKDDEDYMRNMKNFYEFVVFSGVPLQKQSPKDVANFFGEVGKRIDEAYVAGKCTDEQKEMLEKMLGDTAVEFSNRAQRRQAFFKIAREEFNMPIAERKALIESREKMTPEEKMAERKAKINEYVEKFFKVDQETLFNMINAVRYSNLNVLSLLPKA